VERARRHRRLVAVHPHGRRVHEYVRVREERRQFVEPVGRRARVFGERFGRFDGAVGDVDRRVGVPEREHGGPARAARARDDSRLARQRHVVVRERPPHAVDVGVVAGRLAAREVDGVHRPDARREVVDRDELPHRLLERDGDVQARHAERPRPLDCGFEGRRLRLERDVPRVHTEFVVGRLVHRRRQRVLDRIPDESVDVHTGTRGRVLITGTHTELLFTRWPSPVGMAESLLLDGAILVAGILLLYVGAEFLVSAASALALSHGVRAATVGVTVVAFATTAPELFVSTVGGITADDSIALGNIVGSNIANIGLVLGTAAVLRPMDVDKSLLYQHGPFMLAAAVALVALSLDGELAAFDGVVLLGMLAAFTGYLYYQSRQEGDVKLPEDVEMDEDTSANTRDYVVLVGAILLLLAGSRSLITGGRGVLSAWGFSDLFIGLTIIAFGTSVPELATSVVSALRDEADFSIGNVVGSNIYNVLAVIGLVAVLVPITVQPGTIGFELPVMLGFTFVALGLMAVGDSIGRIEGVGLLGGYAGFVYFLLP